MDRIDASTADSSRTLVAASARQGADEAGADRSAIFPRYTVDPEEAVAVARVFTESPALGQRPEVIAAYKALQDQSDRMFDSLTHPHCGWAIRIVFTRVRAPYASDTELIDGVRDTQVLEVTSSACYRDRLHPLMSCHFSGAYDRFRAVHDVCGHVLTGLGFDRDDEYAAWRIQDKHYRGLARWALATELHAEHSVLWTTGQLPQHKAILIEPWLLDWAVSGLKPEKSDALDLNAYPPVLFAA